MEELYIQTRKAAFCLPHLLSFLDPNLYASIEHTSIEHTSRGFSVYDSCEVYICTYNQLAHGTYKPKDQPFNYRRLPKFSVRFLSWINRVASSHVYFFCTRYMICITMLLREVTTLYHAQNECHISSYTT